MSDTLLASPHDDLEAYALGALDPEDEQRFGAHLGTCERCSTDLASYVPVINALRHMPHPVPPPVPSVSAPAIAARRRFPLLPFAYAAAAAVLLALGGGLYRVMTPQSDSMLMTVAGMMADGPRQVALTGSDVRGRVIVGRRGRRTAVIVRGLSPAPAGFAYRVWFEGGRSRLLGSLTPARNGLEVLLVDGNQLADVRSVVVELDGLQTASRGNPLATGVVQ
jgi:Putative zinc-finger